MPEYAQIHPLSETLRLTHFNNRIALLGNNFHVSMFTSCQLMSFTYAATGNKLGC